MAEKFYVKTSPSGWNQVTNFFVKTAANSWSTVSDAYVKVSSSLWQLFYSSLMSPSQQVEIEYFFYGTNTDSYRLQGTNYKWSPTPQSLKYYFRHVVDNTTTYYIGPGGSSGTVTSNPATSIKLPGVSTYVNIDPAGSNYSVGVLNSYNFEVRATGASGTVYPSISAPFEFRSPKAPTLSFVTNTSTSVTLTITASSQNDYFATGRYILYTYDGTSGYVYSGGGRGGFSPTSSSMTKSLTGLVSGRNYVVYVLPITGTTGTTPSNYSGYPGVTGSLSGVTTGSADPQPFNTISYVKNFPSSSSGGVVRTTSLSWNASTNATQYEIEYEGSYNNSSWTTLQTFGQSPYTSSTSQSISWGSPIPSGGFDYYTYMRARVRASNPDSAVNVIGDSGSYIYAAGDAPGQPTFGAITYNSAGTTASVTASVGTTGSNYLYSPPFEYQYRAYNGSYSGTWISSSSPISLTGLTDSTTYYIKIRTRNYDELVSTENETSFNTPAASIAPTGGSASISGASAVGSTLTLTKTDAVGQPNPSATWLWRISDGGFGGNTFNGGSIVQNGGLTYTSQYSGYSVRVEITWSNAVAPAQSIVTNSIAVTASVLTAPTPYNVIKSGSNYLVYFTGGSGPAYQVWWQGSAGTPTTTSYDASFGSSPITVTNLTASPGSTYYFSVRSVSSAGNTGSGPSSTISAWSGQYAYTEPSSTPATAPGTPGTPANGWTSGTTYPFSWTSPSAGTVAGGGAATINNYSMKIYEATSSSGTGATLINTFNTGSGSSNYTYTSPNAALYYAASVAAINSAGLQGPYSGISLYK